MHQSPFAPSELYGRFQGENQRLLTRRILPIIGTCVLIYWLEGGISPSSWTQLVQVCAHLSTLWASNGSSVLLSVVLLTIQALCVALAWCCLIWLMVRMVRDWRSSNVSLSTTVPNVHPVAKVTERAFPVGEQQPFMVLPQSSSLGYRFEPIQPEPQPAMPPIPPATSQAEKQPPLTPLSLPIEVGNLFDVTHDIVNPFQPGATANDPSIQTSSQKPAASTSADIILHHPFDQTLIPDPTYISPTAIPPAYIPQNQSTSTDDDDDDSFAFGNPFEGPLPDVFYQDPDLRKSIMEQTGKVIDPPNEPQKPKKQR